MAAPSGASVETRVAPRKSPRRALFADFAACRAATLEFFRGVDAALFRAQIDPGYSPLGWHLGHIAYTEALWLLDGAVTTPVLARAFAVDGLPKAERVNIPDADETFGYLGHVRDALLERLADHDSPLDEAIWRFVLQHESQHAETATFLLALARATRVDGDIAPDARPLEFVCVPRGTATIGASGEAALDNERAPHRVEVHAFSLGRYPVTQGQFAAFNADGGYRRRELWSGEGWAWREAEAIERPLYWRSGGDHPVMGVSAYEADAFCRWANARLPSEFEWEHAARGLVVSSASGNIGAAHRGTTAVGRFPGGRSADGAFDLFGNVWEWTGSTFGPYPGFRAWPYEGYSQAWFDGRHRVLRGGSWATRSFALRPSFRNWYGPETRQIFAGFRCARDLSDR